ncbi:MAG: LapA family protein [Pseudomonadota bacterium]
MRYLIRSLWLVVFVFLLGFSVKNSAVVTVRFFFDTAWQTPLVMVMFLFFLAGAAVGLSAVLATVLRQRREILRLQQELARTAEPIS